MERSGFKIQEFEELHAPIRKRIRGIISLIRDNPKLTYEDIARLTNTSRKTAERDLTKLKTSGVLRKRGNTRNTSWLVDEEKAKETEQYLAS